MLKFFRKTRQKLLKERRPGKYLVYALGEILLVVIGILIALQVNNWNEGKQRNVIFEGIIEAFEDDLMQNARQANVSLKWGYQKDFI